MGEKRIGGEDKGVERRGGDDRTRQGRVEAHPHSFHWRMKSLARQRSGGSAKFVQL